MVNKAYRLVIFDWDGTVMDSAGQIVFAMQEAAAECNLPIPSEEAVKSIIGISLIPAIAKLFNCSESLASKVALSYKTAYPRYRQGSGLFAGSFELLQRLHSQQYQLAVATGKARKGLQEAFAQTDTGGFFHASRCADEAQSKPHPDMLLQLLDTLECKPSEAVMVGDTVYDMHMAQQIGMDRIAVSYGVHHPKQLLAHEPIGVAHSPIEIANWL